MMKQTYIFNYDKTRMADTTDFGDGSYHDDLTAHDGMACQADMTTSVNDMVNVVFGDSSELQVYCDELDGSVNMVFTTEDGQKIEFDEWEEFTEDGKVVYYWGSICKKCIDRIGRHNIESHLSDGSTACCSVCGCDTPSYFDSFNDDDGMMYIDFQPSEVFFQGRTK